MLSWGPAIAGHAVDEVNDALKAQIDKGTSFGAPCELEVRGFMYISHVEFTRVTAIMPKGCATQSVHYLVRLHVA